jgi:hypothetical protein
MRRRRTPGLLLWKGFNSDFKSHPRIANRYSDLAIEDANNQLATDLSDLANSVQSLKD